MNRLHCIFALSCCLAFLRAATALAAPTERPLAPTERAFSVCTDYHCNNSETVILTSLQWATVVELFARDASPADERENIRLAIALLETNVGAVTGTWRDLGGNFAGSGLPGQLDCIAESRNTTTYLHLLTDAGLLMYHGVEPREVRQPWIFDVHWAAVIRDRVSGERFAVDSWFLDNGQPPSIQPLDDWLSGRRVDNR